MTATLLATRAVIRLSGEDCRGFLQGLVTSDVGGALPVWAALLTPQGKVLFDFLIWADGDDLLLDCEADQAEALAKRLSLYRLRRPITIARDPAQAVHWRADGAGNDPRLPALGTRWIGPPEGEAADAQWLAHRLSLGVCEGRAELADLLWLECNAAELNGVSFTKGCYVGQENTARMNWRQKVNRRLVVVPIEESDPARRRVAYPDLGLAVDHRRVDDISAAGLPQWLAEA
ncbi:folate-binding protein YgfZ [Novosphingobium sp. TH158]|uniref:CAF17-like 4Fe-4S cluster assembly/insertion protein YgfZ n=1 Tax=Novosphingobium sp. TH158 TaxID=2067455 RepID=UPI000C7BCA4A|nr:folate-binding protein YgfZ [Novosphingobium sp. TH158]PLK26567.1 folate-binding protein YgfZ [Novosphingobium sp. TH158]